MTTSLRFGSGSKTISGVSFSALIVNYTGAYTLSGSPTVNGILTMTNNNINLSTFNLTVNGSISGGSTTSYIRADNSGRLIIKNVGATPVTFPIGTGTEYLPITSFVNNGTADDYGAKVSSPATPSCVLAAQTLNVIWDVSETTAGGSNADMTDNIIPELQKVLLF